MPQRLALVGGLLSVAVFALSSHPPPEQCHLEVIKDYELPVVYRAYLRLSPAPACGLNTVLRIRKSSTLNTRRNGAPYQPILPLEGAWQINHLQNGVPANQLWTLYSWKWQWWNPDGWSATHQSKGRWEDAEVINYVQNAR